MKFKKILISSFFVLVMLLSGLFLWAHLDSNLSPKNRFLPPDSRPISFRSNTTISEEEDSLNPQNMLKRKLAALPAASNKVITFYYPWYGNPAHNGGWLHWNHEVLDGSKQFFTPPEE